MSSIKRNLIPIKKIILLVFLASCQHVDEGVYYDLYLNDDAYPSGSYRLFENGKYIYYKYNRSTDERYVFDEGDAVRSNRWSMYNDTMNIDGDLFLVLKITNDSSLIRSLNTNRREELRKSKRQGNE